MNIYNILKFTLGKKIPSPLKIAGLWSLMLLKKRVVGVFIDPVLSCNLQCRMCYFSDPQKRKSLHGIMSPQDVDTALDAFLPFALKLQIGCGAEPTLYSNLPKIIEKGKSLGVPFISITTNGQLIGNKKINLLNLAQAGLNEITLSLHGTTKHIYEHLMPGAKFEYLCSLLNIITDVKKQYPNLSLRVNYTINSLNISDLHPSKFWNLFPSDALPDIIQLRPVQKIGESDWKDFDPQPILNNYKNTIKAIAEDCKKLNIRCIYPTPDNIIQVAQRQDGNSALIEDITYAYISPEITYKEDFNPQSENFYQYHRRKNTLSQIFKNIFSSPKSREKRSSKKLNYKIT